MTTIDTEISNIANLFFKMLNSLVSNKINNFYHNNLLLRFSDGLSNFVSLIINNW